MPLVHDETGDAPEGGNVTVHAPGAAVPSFDPLSVMWAGAKGAAKEAISPFTYNIPNADKKSPLINFSESHDPDHPYAEQAGRLAADVAPMALIPELDVAGGIANAANSAKMLQTYLRHPQVVSGLHNLANWAFKGGIGGALQAKQDPLTGARVGAEAGVGSQLLRNTVTSLARRHPMASAISLPVLAYLAWQERGRLTPYLAWHAGQTIPAAASAIAPLFPPGVAGALGEKAAQATGYDRANKPPQPPASNQPPEDELVPRR